AAAIVAMAVQEDVDIICVSILSGAHNILFEQIMASLKDAGALDIPVLGGGVIPQQDIVTLKEMGVREIFTPGARLDEITDYIENLVWPDDEA
ncbi:MAG: methylmalonyl-CoA mutase, partial [Rhodospirillaceae bacterium]|nr:methylmalonyl-CoA mutase [Rhodospirillaceae bacterium]